VEDGEALIQANGLSKRFAGKFALSEVSFSIRRGESVGLLGENGAGKTTTFRLLSGSLAPSSGSVQIGPYPLSTAPHLAKKAIGYMPEAQSPYPELSAREYLRFRAELSGRVASRQVRSEVERALQLTDIREGSDRPLGTQSKGYRQRALLSAALLGDPSVLLLDEPTSGLDPTQVLEFRELIRRLARDRTILLSTHVLSEVEATCSRALVLKQGSLVADDSLQSLRRRVAERRVFLRARGEPSALKSLCRSHLVGAEGLELEDDVEGSILARYVESDRLPLATLVREVCVAGFAVLECGTVRARLDEVFLSLMQERLQEPSPGQEPPSAPAHEKNREGEQP
jgi:ABC-2 type transport system ATP-binding protein